MRKGDMIAHERPIYVCIMQMLVNELEYGSPDVPIKSGQMMYL